MGIQSADLCFYCHSCPAWIGKTSREGRRIGQRATISCKNGHRRQKYFLSLIFSSFSIFTLWLPFIPHFPSCFIWALLFSSSPSWNILKIPPAGHWCNFQGKLARFSLYKAELCQISSSFRRLTLIPNTSWRKTTQQVLTSVGHCKSCTPPTEHVRVSSVFVLQASDGIQVWTVIHHQKGHSFTRWFP